MRFLARLFCLLFIVSSLLFLVSSPIRADGEFKTDYKVRYEIGKNGPATVTQNIVLTNQTPNFYADKFELKIGSTKVTDVKAKDETGDLQTELKFENDITTINVKFNQRVIGQGKTLSWILTYSTDEIASKSGQIWEISIPKLAKSQDVGNYDATVIVPKSFGPSAFTLPIPQNSTQNAQNQEFTFTKDQLLTSGIAMSFGLKQIFSYNLKYYLENTNLTAQIYNISLPPDNNYQRTVLEKIDPKPLDVVVDEDGNFQAKYKLLPKEKLAISVEGEVEVFSKPFRKIVQSLADAQKEIYTQPQRYWETDNAYIKDKAQELKTPEKIYQYVTEFLSYNSDRLNEPKLERKGAAAAYSSPKDSVCMEFTDLFIALARAAHIPAREVQGYAYTQNERLRPLSLSLYEGDILHAWPEYWDNDRGWIQIDPTWASTSGGLDYFNKLDFNHITFIERGVSSVQPYPAGAYKSQNQRNEKTVFVQFAQNLPNPTSKAQIELDAPTHAFGSFPFKVKATLINTGSTSIFDASVKVTATNLQNQSDSIKEIPILPPFARKDYSFSFLAQKFLQSATGVLVFSFSDTQTSRQIKIEPLYKLFIDPMFLLSLTATAVIITIGLFLYRKTHRQAKISLER